MSYHNDADDRAEVRRSEWVAKLLVPVAVVGHVLFYVVLPASLTWAVGWAGGADLFSGFDSAPIRRVAGIGMFLSAVAAIITTESVTRLGRPFSVGHFVVTMVVMGAALFPSLAEWHRVRLGLAPEHFVVLQSYCYLALRVVVGILIGATVSWILLGRYTSVATAPRPQYSRK
ncbi:MAG: hypothetical protein ACREJ9_07455 [Candidatus Rokuibacteriota bacterium]